jgi:hypothetical protein
METLEERIKEWKEATIWKIAVQKQGDVHARCPNCNDQLFYCDCVAWEAQDILEQQHKLGEYADE